MRILIFTTRSRPSLDEVWLAQLVAKLPFQDPELALVTVSRPIERLSVDRCLVVRASLRPRRNVREAAVRGRRRTKRERATRRRASSRRGPLGRAIDSSIRAVAPKKIADDRRTMLASGAAWSPQVREEFGKADFVVAHDVKSVLAAWLLARRIRGPHVVFGVEGVALKLSELEGSS